MLLSPQLQQQRFHLRKHGFCPMDFSVTARAKRDHQVKKGLSRHPMVNDDRSLVSSGSSARAASVPIPFKNPLPKTAEVFLILPFKGVAGRTEAIGEDLLPAAPAIQRPLLALAHLFIIVGERSSAFDPTWIGTFSNTQIHMPSTYSF